MGNCLYLDLRLFKWLCDNVKLFIENADDHTDLNCNVVAYNGYEYTVNNLLELLVYKLETILKLDKFDDEYKSLGDDIFEIMALVWTYLWW